MVSIQSLKSMAQEESPKDISFSKYDELYEEDRKMWILELEAYKGTIVGISMPIMSMNIE